MEGKIEKTDEQWQEQLTAEQYHVAREKGTEPAFSGQYWNTKSDGVYQCVCCGQPLFEAKTKYDSGTGWPSFWAPIAEENIHTHSDRSLLMERVEVLCMRCNAHLGHVFDDGPPPTNLRYCINESSLRFIPRKS